MIDWSKFEGSPKSNCHCKCGNIFKSYAKYVKEDNAMATQSSCPKCGEKSNCWKYSSDKEKWVL